MVKEEFQCNFSTIEETHKMIFEADRMAQNIIFLSHTKCHDKSNPELAVH